MIERTFQILPTVGSVKERKLWDNGILTWNDFIDSDDISPLPRKNKERYDSILNYAYQLLDEGDCSGLSTMVKSGEHWRLYDRFKNSVSFLDIETDGLERDSTVTVVTVCKNNETITLTEGIDLTSETLKEALEDTSMLVTFNGSCFDVPVLKYSFPDVNFDYPHFDLRFGCKKVGLKGGLKLIEKEIGICRDESLAEVDGFEAVRLWKRWERNGDREALDKLTEYNRADTVNLRTLADFVYGRMVTEYAGFDHTRSTEEGL